MSRPPGADYASKPIFPLPSLRGCSTIQQGKFLDPSEAAFVVMGEHEELESHTDLRAELLKRSLQAVMDDPRPGIPHEEGMAEMREQLQQPRPEPAKWEKRSRR